MTKPKEPEQPDTSTPPTPASSSPQTKYVQRSQSEAARSHRTELRKASYTQEELDEFLAEAERKGAADPGGISVTVPSPKG